MFIDSRTLVNIDIAQRHGQLVTDDTTLQKVQARLFAVEALQQPQDFTGRIKEFEPHLTLNSFKLIHPVHLPEPTSLFKVAASQLQRFTLPPNFWTGFKKLMGSDAQGADLAEQVWTKFAEQDPKSRVIRTALMKQGTSVHRVIRACVSEQYAAYRHTHLIATMMAHMGEYTRRPVLSWTLTDNALRVRFAALSDALVVFSGLDPTLMQSTPFPMVEFWNSEVGMSGIHLRGGMYKLGVGGKTYALPHWESYTKRSWIHRGDIRRIEESVASKFAEAIGTSTEMVEAFEQAKQVMIEDPYAETAKQLKAKLTEKQLDAYKVTLGDGTRSLAHAVDALGTVAAEEDDIIDQAHVEREASHMLRDFLGVKSAPSSDDLTLMAALAAAN